MARSAWVEGWKEGGGAEVLTPSSRSMGVAPPTVTQGDEARIPIPREDEDDNIVAGILRPTGAELETVDMAIRVYHATDVPQSAWRPRRRASLARAWPTARVRAGWVDAAVTTEDVSLKTGNRRLDAFTGQGEKEDCDPYVRVSFAGKVGGGRARVGKKDSGARTQTRMDLASRSARSSWLARTRPAGCVVGRPRQHVRAGVERDAAFAHAAAVDVRPRPVADLGQRLAVRRGQAAVAAAQGRRRRHRHPLFVPARDLGHQHQLGCGCCGASPRCVRVARGSPRLTRLSRPRPRPGAGRTR